MRQEDTQYTCHKKPVVFFLAIPAIPPLFLSGGLFLYSSVEYNLRKIIWMYCWLSSAPPWSVCPLAQQCITCITILINEQIHLGICTVDSTRFKPLASKQALKLFCNKHLFKIKPSTMCLFHNKDYALVMLLVNIIIPLSHQ